MYKIQAFERSSVSFGLKRKITMDVENKPVPWFSKEMKVKNISSWGGSFESSTSKARWLYIGLLNAFLKVGKATASSVCTSACL